MFKCGLHQFLTPCVRLITKGSLQSSKYGIESHWTLKNSMRCAKICFYVILVAAISGRQTPEICSWGERCCPRSVAVTCSIAVIGHPTFQLRGEHYHWAMTATAKCSPPMTGCHVMLWWTVTEEPTIGEKDYASLVYLLGVHAKPFVSDFEIRSNINRVIPEPQYLLVCIRISFLFFVQRTFDWDGGNGFV